MRDALRLPLVCLLGLSLPWACTFHDETLPTDIVVGTWSAAPASGTVADGVEVATLRLRLSDPNMAARAHIGVCLTAEDSRVQLRVQPGSSAELTADAHCALRGTTDAEGMLAAQVAMLANPGDANALEARVTGYVIQNDAAHALWAPGSVAFVAPVAKAGLHIEAAGNTTVAGQPATFRVGMYDGAGARINDYTGTVIFSSNDAQASLPPAYTFGQADLGQADFTATFATVGTQFLVVRDPNHASFTAQAGISVLPGDMRKFGLSLSPPRVVAGQSATLNVTAQDSAGNTVTAYNAQANLTLTLDGNVARTATESFTAGIATISLNADASALDYTLVGTSHSLQIADKQSGIIGELDAITVVPNQASRMLWSVDANAKTGQRVAATLTLLDAFDNVATGFVGNLNLTSSDPQALFFAATNNNTQLATVPANANTQSPVSVYAFAAGDAGTHTFGLAFQTVAPPTSPGNTSTITQMQNVTVTDPAHALADAMAWVTVAASQNFLGIKFEDDTLTQTSTLVAGATCYLQIGEYDTTGTVAPALSRTLRVVSVNDPNAIIAANPFVMSLPGSSNANAFVFTTAGQRTIVVTETATGYTGATTVTVVAASPNQLVLSNVAARATAGDTASPTATIQDAYGNIVTSYRGSPTFSIDDPRGSLPASYTFTATDAGVHTFTNAVVFRTARQTSLSAADPNTPSLRASVFVQVAPASPNSLSTHIASATASALSTCMPLSATILASDAYGNTATQLNDGNATLMLSGPHPPITQGPLTAPMRAGVAALPALQFNTAGTYTTQASFGALQAPQQTVAIAQSTPSITLTNTATLVSGLQSIDYTTQGACGLTAAISYVPSSGSASFLATQGVSGLMQGTLLPGTALGQTGRTFIWDSPNDLGYGQQSGSINALLVDSASNVVRAQSNTSLAINANNRGRFGVGAPVQTLATGPSAAALYDVDADGQLDVAYASTNTLVLALGNAGGQPKILTTASLAADSNAHVAQIAIGDIGHDGVARVVACWNNDSNNTGQVVVYTPDFSSTPALAVTATFSVACRGLVLTDYNSDGIIDVVTASADQNSLLFLPFTQGTLKVALVSALAFTPSTLSAADINRDGALDYLITAASSTQMNLAMSNPNANPPGSAYTLSGVNTQTPFKQAAFADINRDGVYDIIGMGSAGDSNVYVMLGANGTYSSVIISPLLSTAQTPPFVLADFNGDGLLDIATSGTASTPARIFSSDGNSRFSATPTHVLAAAAGTTVLATGDLDNNGAPDLFLGGSAGAAAALNTDATRYSTEPRGVVGYNVAALGNTTYVAAGDLNGDGFADLVVLTQAASQSFVVQYLLGDSTGRFVVTSAQTIKGYTAGPPVVVDFNLDGFDDVVIPGQSSAGGGYGYTLGPASAAPTSLMWSATVANYATTQQLIVADFDGDGNQDVALAGGSSAQGANGLVSLAASAQTPTVTFPPTAWAPIASAGTAPLQMAATSPNDMTTGAAATSLIVWSTVSASSPMVVLRNNGQASFTPLVFSDLTHVYDVVVADFNNDNLFDMAYTSSNNPNALLLSVSATGNPLASRLSTDLGTCTPTNVVRLPMPQFSGASVALSCTQGPYTRAIFNANLTTGIVPTTTPSYTIIPTNGVTSTSLLAADVNGDARQDIISVGTQALNPQASALSIALAGAGAYFSNSSSAAPFVGVMSSAIAATPVYSIDVGLADIDNDGDLDAVVANANSKSVSVYPGNRDGTFAAASTVVSLADPARGLITGDLGRTGSADVFVRTASSVTVLSNTQGILSKATSTALVTTHALAADGATTQLSLRDVDQDGYLDVIVLTASGVLDVHPWLVSSKTLGSATATSLNTAAPQGFAFGDLAHSGADNIVIAATPVLVLTRDGHNYDYAAAATPPQQVSAISGAQAIALGDVDHDGNLDLVYIAQDGSALSWLKGKGDSTFASTNQSRAALPIFSGSLPRLRALDLNRDGYLDAIIAWPQTATAVFVPGLAGGAWGAARPYAIGSTIGGMAVGDINNDTRPDIVFSHATGMWPPLLPASAADSVVSILGR